MDKEDFIFGLMIFLIITLLIFSVSGKIIKNDNSIKEENLSDNIIVDEKTHIMYYMLPDHYMCPYYSENGYLCRYEDGKIIEVKR